MAVLLVAPRHRSSSPLVQRDAGAALIGLALHPLSVCDAGAWLTSGATVAIIIAASATTPLLGRVRSAEGRAGLLVASLAAELALFPISASVFSRVTAAGLVLNFAEFR